MDTFPRQHITSDLDKNFIRLPNEIQDRYLQLAI